MNDTAMARASDQQSLARMLEGQSNRIKEISGGSVLPARLAQLAFLAVRKTPALQNCTVASVIAACLDAARLGLEPDGVQGAIIPYKGSAAFQPMYRGLIALAFREGSVDAIEARVAFAGDDFRIELGSRPLIHHMITFAADGTGGFVEVSESERKPICYYAVAHMRGVSTFDFMRPHEIEAIRKRAPSASRSSPWDTDYDEMAKKTVIKRLLKKLPASARLRDALAHDNDIDAVEGELAAGATTQTSAKSGTGKMLAAKQKAEKAKAQAVDAPQTSSSDDEPPDYIDGDGGEGEGDPPPPEKAADDAPLVALMRAIPRVTLDDKGTPTRQRHFQHMKAAKQALTEEGYQMIRLLTCDRFGETSQLSEAEMATLTRALTKLKAAGGYIEP